MEPIEMLMEAFIILIMFMSFFGIYWIMYYWIMPKETGEPMRPKRGYCYSRRSRGNRGSPSKARSTKYTARSSYK